MDTNDILKQQGEQIADIKSRLAQLEKRPVPLITQDGLLVGGPNGTTVQSTSLRWISNRLLVGPSIDTGLPNTSIPLVAQATTTLGNTVGSCSYPFELRAMAGNTLRSQIAAVRHVAGSTWFGAGWRWQLAVDNDFTTGQLAFVHIAADATGGGNVFIGTNNTNRITVLANGNVGLGAVTPTALLELATDSAKKPTTTTWTVTSDGRTKTKIKPYTAGLNELVQFNVVEYEHNGKAGTVPGSRGVGIIAQDAEKIQPTMVSRSRRKLDPDDPEETEVLDFNPHEWFFMMINSFKTLNQRTLDSEARISTLEQENRVLKAQVEAFERRLNALERGSGNTTPREK